MLNNSFFPTITLPTRFSTYSCSLLDNIFCKQTKHVRETRSGIIFTQISDHLPCFTNIKFQTKFEKRPPKFVKQKININSAMESLLRDLESQDVYVKLDHDLEKDPNDNYNVLSDCINDCKNKHFPTKLVKFNKRRHKNNQWMTYSIINSINKRDQMYKELKSIPPNTVKHTNLKHNLSLLNDIIKKDIRREKKKY